MNKYVVLYFAWMLTGAIACKTAQTESKANYYEEEGQMALTQKKGSKKSGQLSSVSSPVVYVYKTKKDYSHQVPVIMDQSRSQILSYPHPKDLLIGGKLCLPTPLEQGYWLDNKGINPQVAFLKYTYEEYSQLPQAPSMEMLMENILDKNPLTEIHACGRRMDYVNLVEELNQKIEQGTLSSLPTLQLERQSE